MSPVPAQAAATPLVLLTGDRVLASMAAPGANAITILSAPHGSALAGSLVAMRFGARSFLVPAAALPYLGRGLDPACSTCPPSATRSMAAGCRSRSTTAAVCRPYRG